MLSVVEKTIQEMKYGLPYKGSKNKLAERIVHLLPKRKNLVDLFCGGCAVSHAALLMGKYEHIHINDLNWMPPTLFIEALQGKYNNDTRWISRDDFFRLRDTDPYVAVVWSFGNNLRDYLYSRDIEPLKKAIHYAIFFSDYSLGQALGHDLSFIDPIRDVQRRYIAVKRYFSQFGHFQQQSLEGGGTLQVEHLTRTERLNSIRGGAVPADAERGSLATAQHQPPVIRGGSRVASLGDSRKTTQYLSEYHPLERTSGGVFQRKETTIGAATHGVRQPNVGNQKKNLQATIFSTKTTSDDNGLHRLQYRERQHSMPTNPIWGGGNRCPSQAVRLTMPRSRYPKTA